MFKWFVVLCASWELLSANGQTVRYAEKRVINSPVDYNYHQFITGQPSPGLSAYSDFVQKTTEPSVPGELPKNIRTIILTKKVPVPYPVHVQKNIPYPVKVPVRRPYTVYVPRPYYVEVMKQVPFPVKVPFPQPYTVEKHVPVPYKVHYDKPYPVHVSKPYPVFFEKRVPIQIEKPVPIPYKVPVDRPYPVHIPVEKPVLFPVERPYHFPLKVPVERPVASHVQKPIPVPVTVEKPQLATNEHSITADYYSSTQPTTHNTFSPSTYDEMTSTLITQGKHKVMSFLPGSQNNLGSYGDHSDIGTIHVSDIKGGGGNSTDWVPKQYVSNNQYLTYIPSTQPKYQYQFIVPEKTTKLNPVRNAEPYVVKHNSVKMHYKLHFDPVKQEYSFQLMPRPVSDAAAHAGYDYQSLKSESKNRPPGKTDSQQQQYFYRQVHDHSSASGNQPPTKPDDGLTYTFQHLYQGKPEFNSIQPGPDSQALTYSYPNQQQDSNNYNQEGAYTFQTVDPAAKPLYDHGSQVAGNQPEVSYSYEQPSPEKQSYQQEPPPNAEPHQITYSYSVDNDGKLGYGVQSQLKNSETYPSEQVRYMYVPQASVSNAYAEARDTTNLQPTYTMSTEQNEVNTEYPQILYQQGRAATILRDEFGATQPTITDQGKIPEQFKSSRASVDIAFYNFENDTGSSEVFSNSNSDQSVHTESGSGFHIENVHPFNKSNKGDNLRSTSSITFQKFGVADVMTPGRTKLYPVNETTTASAGHEEKVDLYNMMSDYASSWRDSYFQQDSTSSTSTEYPFNTKVYRLPSYKVPKSKKGNRRRNNKDSPRPTKTTEDHTQVYEEDNTTAVQWYDVFTHDVSAELTTKRSSSLKETNSHTGAAERAPFYNPYHVASSATTTTSSSLLPPDDVITRKPTQSLKRSRGSTKAFGRKKEEESTTEVYDPSAETAKVTRRRRRPGARRRSDRVTEPPTEDVEQYKL